MKKSSISTYSRMYLVTPTVYEKLLTCIDEKDKKVTENLNVSKSKKDRPSDDVIHELNIESFNEPREVEFQAEPEEMFEGEGEVENEGPPPQSDIIYQSETPDQPGDIDMPQNDPTEMSSAKTLESPCVLSSERGEVIPQGGLIYRPKQKEFKAIRKPVLNIPRLTPEQLKYYTKPNVEHKKLLLKQPVINIPRLTQSQIESHVPQQVEHKKLILKQPVLSIPRLSQSQILKKPILSIPKLTQSQIESYSPKSLQAMQQSQIEAFSKNPVTSKQKVIVPTISKTRASKIKNFQCTICLKFWRSKWDLKRHLGTVHSNVTNVPMQTESEQQVPPFPDTDETMEENFPVWKRTRSEKRTSTQAKLPTLKPKFRPPGGEDDDDGSGFQQWK